MRFLFAIALAAIAFPMAAAQPPENVDVLVTLTPTGAPGIEAEERILTFNDSTPGERFLFDLATREDHVTIEIRARGFHVDRAEQLVPSLLVPETEYPLFHDFPHERTWEVDGPANVFHVTTSGEDIVLRLGVAGPRNVTLALTVDTAPPGFTIGERQDLTHIGFYQETTTDELALANLQVRRVGADVWIDNPTPQFHVLQRFPVQGLDPETPYESRVVFTDRAGNEATSEIMTFVTPPAPELPTPTVRIVSPSPNATLPAGTVTVRAQVESNESPVSVEGVRVFFDKRERSGFTYRDGEVVFTPEDVLLPGTHSVSVEVTNEAGGRGDARWTFEIAGANEAPLPVYVGLIAALLALAWDMSARPRQR